MNKQIQVEVNFDENDYYNGLSKGFVYKYICKYIKRVASISKFSLLYKDDCININKLYDIDEDKFGFDVDEYPKYDITKYTFVIYREYPSMTMKEPIVGMELKKFFKNIKENNNGKEKEKSN
jgi:hypothetical protein